MTIIVTIQADNAIEVREQLTALLGAPEPNPFDVEDKLPAEETVEKVEAPKRRGRPRKAAAEPVSEPEQTIAEEDADLFPGVPQQISTGEERINPEEEPNTEEPRFPATLDGLKAALAAHVEEFGSAETLAHRPALLGYPKFSQVPDEPAVIAAAIARIDTALATGKPGGA